MTTMQLIVDLVLNIENYEIRLEQQEAFRLGLFLTGHNWGEGEGKVRYMGSLAKKSIIQFRDNAYPDQAVVDYYAESNGRSFDEVTIVLAPTAHLKTSRDALSKLINKYLEMTGFVKIPCTGEYVDNSSSLEPTEIPAGTNMDGNALTLSVGYYVGYRDALNDLRHHGIFYGNKSVKRPANVRLIALADRAMNDG